jgi:hypothetical protein
MKAFQAPRGPLPAAVYCLVRVVLRRRREAATARQWAEADTVARLAHARSRIVKHRSFTLTTSSPSITVRAWGVRGQQQLSPRSRDRARAAAAASVEESAAAKAAILEIRHAQAQEGGGKGSLPVSVPASE